MNNKLDNLLNAGIDDNLELLFENDDFKVIIAKSKIKYMQKSFIIFDGKHYFLIDKDNNILGKSRNRKNLIPKSMANQL